MLIVLAFLLTYACIALVGFSVLRAEHHKVNWPTPTARHAQRFQAMLNESFAHPPKVRRVLYVDADLDGMVAEIEGPAPSAQAPEFRFERSDRRLIAYWTNYEPKFAILIEEYKAQLPK